ncbi:MAG: hypothetical protein FWB91_01125 [Defluviitaleaceae bacterium]|nr:hypothetical protein [Defluviitaleaceae bacterium]
MKRIIVLLIFALFLTSCGRGAESTDSDEAEANGSDAVMKFVSNLQPGLPAPIPAKKTQLDWLIYGAGGNDTAGRINAEGEPVPLHESVTGLFSYQFTCEAGEIKGRVEGNNGEISIFALGENGTFTRIRYENGAFFRGATGDALAYENEAAAYKLAIQFIAHFADMTRAGHDHSYAPLPYNLGVLSVERFPVDFRPIDGNPANILASNNLHVRDRDADGFIIFFYDGQDAGGMMNAMWFNGTVKWVSNLQPSLSAPIPAKEIQFDWLTHGAGLFSYQFTSEDGTIAGRVEGDNGEIRIFALRENGTFARIRYENGTFFRGATGDTLAYENEIAAYELAVQFAVHFATMTGLMTFEYDGEDDGGMLRVMILPGR